MWIKDEEAAYQEYLDGLDISILERYAISQLLEAVDPTAYNVGFSDFVSNLYQCDMCDEYFSEENDLHEYKDRMICEDCFAEQEDIQKL